MKNFRDLGLSIAVVSSLCGCSAERDQPDLEGAPTGGTTSSLAGQINAETRAILPAKPGRNWVFDAYVSANSPDVAWSRFWTKALDLSGVAWDKPQTLTMVSPRHAVMARHYQRPPKAQFVLFHERDGREVQRAIIGREFIEGADIAVVLLHEDVPAGVRHYPVLAPSERYVRELPGALALVTDRERKVHAHAIDKISPAEIYPADIVTFTTASSLDDGFFEPLAAGDSGNPSFVLVRGELVLLETHSTGGAGSGPFYGAATHIDAIDAAMRRLSEANGAPVYRLRTVAP